VRDKEEFQITLVIVFPFYMKKKIQKILDNIGYCVSFLYEKKFREDSN